MKPYFEKMESFGKELKKGRLKRAEASVELLRQTEDKIEQLNKDVREAGLPT